MIKEKIAKGIRAISVPPVMVTTLVLILVKLRPQVYRNVSEIIISIALLGIVPVLAYPLQKCIPSLRKKGREAQRNLAFALNILGYGVAFIWSLVINSTVQLKIICNTYFFSVLMLTIFNKLIHIRASGHACSFTGPLVLLIYFIGIKTIIPCIGVSAVIIWASLYLKRHTVKEIVWGMVVCVASFALSLLVVNI